MLAMTNSASVLRTTIRLTYATRPATRLRVPPTCATWNLILDANPPSPAIYRVGSGGSSDARGPPLEPATCRSAQGQLLTDQGRTILHIIPSLRQGGAERILSDVVTKLGGDHRHHVVTLLDEPPFFDLGDADLTTLRMDRTQ